MKNKFKINSIYIVSDEVYLKICQGTDRNVQSIKDGNNLYYGGVIFSQEIIKEKNQLNQYKLTCLGFYGKEIK